MIGYIDHCTDDVLDLEIKFLSGQDNAEDTIYYNNVFNGRDTAELKIRCFRAT